MLESQRLTAILAVTLLTAAAGCSTNISPPAVSDAATPQVNQAKDTSTEPTISAPQITLAAVNPTPTEQLKINQYLNGLAAKGFTKKNQGVWVQSSDRLLANHQGTIPLPAASITKVATSLVALSTFTPNHRFVTTISTTGPIQKGILEGDLIIEGNQDPFFIWEEAFALGNFLNQLGIKRVKGNLVISGKFYMNYEYDPLKSGNLLKVGMNSQLWTPQALTQYRTLPPGTPRPQVIIDGAVKVVPTVPSNAKPLVRHYSPTLADLVKKMNRYSNNKMAEMIADSVGGAKQVAQKAATIAGVPQPEIQLVNGSGLSELNKISPRAAVALFIAIDRYLKASNMSIADVLAVVGQDKGILDERKIPQMSVVKSGSLNNVSALAGALPTKDRGIVWFAIMNGGNNLTGFRTEQELLLNKLVKQWGVVDSLPSELTPTQKPEDQMSRNEVVKE
ncbi:D-alanyl-D-alanine carboxypeptidase [[Phormidium ambiguum] IAM M-71]|uniref:D-alanyl-D-alanine carboxypeptidase n=1 Tax=[Phormidium ambiguum] IAM M-71 TaxID=454136 RepID=A0A1U7IJ01_9CYAN|nr:D-alanyl-D-alanine carboxypeptidase [Phormidium ambiguum]OKH37172.1 D-alanyl-D-alanine carboxypeptidase [Phormidium ambiguum IAM M-71]